MAHRPGFNTRKNSARCLAILRDMLQHMTAINHVERIIGSYWMSVMSILTMALTSAISADR